MRGTLLTANPILDLFFALLILLVLFLGFVEYKLLGLLLWKPVSLAFTVLSLYWVLHRVILRIIFAGSFFICKHAAEMSYYNALLFGMKSKLHGAEDLLECLSMGSSDSDIFSRRRSAALFESKITISFLFYTEPGLKPKSSKEKEFAQNVGQLLEFFKRKVKGSELSFFDLLHESGRNLENNGVCPSKEDISKLKEIRMKMEVDIFLKEEPADYMEILMFCYFACAFVLSDVDFLSLRSRLMH